MKKLLFIALVATGYFLCPSSVQTLRLRLALGESESDLVIQVTDMVTTHTATAIIRMATTGHIGTTATILGRHTTGPTDTAITPPPSSPVTIGTKLM